jgi:NTP pyrophosphatase (non-canonical NTP hydrolase)
VEEAFRLLRGRNRSRVNYETWCLIRELVEGLDRINGEGENETSMRLLKLVEEVGEVGAAYIGATGQNPRKGVTHTKEDVASELCDVMLTAAVALYRFSDKPEHAFSEHVRNVAHRARMTYGLEAS